MTKKSKDLSERDKIVQAGHKQMDALKKSRPELFNTISINGPDKSTEASFCFVLVDGVLTVREFVPGG